MTHNLAYHYPADFLSLLIDTIPCLTKSKKDTFTFFKSAGVEDTVMAEVHSQWELNPSNVSKYDIVRSVLSKLNEGGDKYPRERREVVKRVVEFDSFDACYPDNILKAKGQVAEVQRITNLKDSVTKITDEHERIRQEAL